MSTDIALRDQAAAALQAVKAADPDNGATLEKYLAGLHSRNVAVLGEDEAFALRDGSGDIKCFKQRLVLSAENGGLVQPVYSGPFVVSAQGYEKWAEASGTCVIFPKAVIVDGVEQANPHVIRDTTIKNGRILNIYARAVAFRFSSKGLPMVADWTTTFDVPSYRLIDLVAKAKKQAQAFKLLPAGMEPGEKGTWAKYDFDESTKLWVNTAHPEAIDWYGQILNREKKALDFAQTFARRNACKHLSGLQKAPGPVWDMTVLCWRPMNGSLTKWDSSAYANVQARVEGLSEGQAFALPEGKGDGHEIQLTRGVEHVEDEAAAIVVEADPEDQPAEMYAEAPGTRPEKAPPAESANAPITDEDRKALAQLHAAREEFPDELRQAADILGIGEGANMSPDEARALLREVSRIMDEGA